MTAGRSSAFAEHLAGEAGHAVGSRLGPETGAWAAPTGLRAEFPAGEDQAEWNGREDLGQRVAAGVCQVRVSAGTAIGARKIVIVE